MFGVRRRIRSPKRLRGSGIERLRRLRRAGSARCDSAQVADRRRPVNGADPVFDVGDIRQFAEEQLATRGAATEVRAAHARHFAGCEADILALWDSPRQREAYTWFTVELANLRTAFRWAADYGNLRNQTAAVVSEGCARDQPPKGCHLRDGIAEAVARGRR